MMKILRAILLAFIALILTSGTVLAAYSYYANIRLEETNGNSYSYLPVIAVIDNDYLADNGYISLTGRDTRVLSGSTELKHLVADDKLLFVVPSVEANSGDNYRYTLGNSLLDSFPIITGYNGYITVTNADALELGSNFAIEQKGYVDTSAGSDKNLVYKENAFWTYVSTEGSITSTIYFADSMSPYSSTSDGYIQAVDITYTTARNASTGTVDSTGGLVYIGQAFYSPDYYVFRGYIYFDTSAIPDDAIVTSATLKLYGATDKSTTDFLITIQNGQPTYPHDPLEAGDYNATNYSGDGGSLTTSGFNLAGYNNIALNSTGLTWINKTGTTKLCLRSSRDIAGTAPSGEEFVNVYSAETAGTDKDPQLVVNYTASPSVTATGVSSGERIVKTTAGSNTMTLSVTDYTGTHQGNSPQSVDITGISVADSANDWLLMQNNVMPYMDYYRHTVGGTLIAWYEPISMIIGTNLDDREGTDVGETGTDEEDGIITWGSNPAGISLTIGSLVSSGQPAISPPSEEEAIDIVPEGNIPVSGGTVNITKLQDNPLYPIVKLMNERTGFTEEQIWFSGTTLIILIGMGLAVVKVPNHLLLGGTVGLVLAGFFTAMEIYQWWMMLLFGFIFVMSIIMERKPVF